jgi:hypothetical protein
MCELRVANLIAEYLANQGLIDTSFIDLSIFQKVCPYISEVVGDDVTYQTSLFTEKGLIYKLNSCIRYLQEAQMYEFAISVNQLVTAFHEKSKSYVELSSDHKNASALYDMILTAVR